MGIEALYTHEFTIERPERTSDGHGGWPETPVVVGTARGRLRPATSTERSAAMQQERLITHVWYCAPETDVRRGDTLSGAGQTVTVVAVREPSHAGSSLPGLGHLEVDCIEVQKAGEQEAGS